jgi:hypothetical protein
MLRKFALKYLIIIVLAIPGQSIVAQNNYRPATSKGTDHSYFKNGKISIQVIRILHGWIQLVHVKYGVMRI